MTVAISYFVEDLVGLLRYRLQCREDFLSNPSVDYVATFLCKDGFMRMISG